MFDIRLPKLKIRKKVKAGRLLEKMMDRTNRRCPEFFRRLKSRFDALSYPKKLIVVILISSIFLSGSILVIAELGGYGVNGPATSLNSLDYGLVGYWNFEEGGGQTVKDVSGSGNDGTLGSSSAVDAADPVFGAGHDSSGENSVGMVFDGVDDYVEVANSSNLNTNSVTISLYIKFNSFPEDQKYFIQKSGRWGLLYRNSKFMFIVWNGPQIYSTTIPSLNTWYHIVGTYDGTGSSKIYINGVQQAIGTGSSSQSSTTSLLIGYASTFGDYHDGTMDDVRIYNRALSEDEVRLLYNQKKPILEMDFEESSGSIVGDKGINNNYALLGGGAVGSMPARVEGKFKGALDFDGVDDYIEVKGAAFSWDLSSASYDAKSMSVTGQDATPRDLFFSSDGSKMYMTGSTNDRVYQYSLAVPWDASSIVSSGKYISVSAQENNPMGVFLNPTGTKLYVIGDTNDRIYQYSLSTAWDISTAIYDNKSLGVASQDNIANDMFFGSDGYKAYIIGSASDKIYQYSLSTAWDISTASYDSKSFSISAQDSTSSSLYLKPDGSKAYVTGTTGQIYQYSLSTAWDISTAIYDSKSFSITSQDITPRGLFFSTEGGKMFMLGYESDTVYQYGFYSNDSLDVGNEITVSLWVKPALGAVSTLLSSGNTASVDYDLYVTQTGKVAFMFTNPAGNWQRFITVSDILAGGEYQHIAATYDGTTYNIYRNGAAQDITWDAGTPGTALANFDYGLFIGKRDYSTDQRFFDGEIDDVRIYNYARTPDEIISDYNGDAIRLGSDDIDLNRGLLGYWDFEEGGGQFVNDKSGNGYTGVLGGSSSDGADDPAFGPGHDSSGENGTGMIFDNADDKIVINKDIVRDDMTMSVWLKPDSATAEQLIFHEGNGAGYGPGPEVDLRISSSLVIFSIVSVYGGSLDAYVYSSISPNVWTNVTVVVEDTQARIYINGVQKMSDTWAGTITRSTYSFNNSVLNVRDGRRFGGSLDEFRVYSRALSDSEVSQLYNQKNPILHLKMDKGTGTALRDDSFNNRDGYIYRKIDTATSGTANTLVDTGNVWTVNEWAGQQVSIVYGLGVGQTRTIISNTTTALTVSQGWVTVPDATSRYAITLPGSNWTKREIDAAVTLPDVGYIGFAAPDNAPISGTMPFTLEAWVKTTSSSVQYIMQQRDLSGTSGEYVLEINGGKARYWDYAGSIAHNLYSAQTVNDGVWHHIAFTRNGRAGAIYVDGVLGGTSDVTAVSISSSLDFAVGCDFRDAQGYMNGSIDDVRVYNYARTADEIFADYNGGDAVRFGKKGQDLDYGLVGHWDMEEGGGQSLEDKSGNGNDGTVGATSGAESSDPAFVSGFDSNGSGGTALRFDGINDYANCGTANSLNITNAITLTAWVKANSFINTSYEGIIHRSHASDPSQSTSYGMNIGWNSSQIVFFASTTAGWGKNVWSSASLSAGQWYHVATTYDSSTNTTSIYINGVLDKSDTTTITGTILVDAARSVQIGKGAQTPIDGTVDDARIYNRAISADEVRMLYNQKKPVLQLKMDEGSGVSVKDESFNDNDGTLGDGTCQPGAGICPSWVQGKSGTALNIDGVDDYVVAPSSASISPSKYITVEAWVNYGGYVHQWSPIVWKNSSYQLDLWQDGATPHFGVAGGEATASSRLQIGAWTHLAGTYDGAYVRLYVDGVQVASQAKSASITVNTNPVYSGAVSGLVWRYKGYIDDVRIYNYARSASEVLTDYNAGQAAHLR